MFGAFGTKPQKQFLPQKRKQILPTEPLKMISRHFTIFTNNTSATFNTNILLNSSSVLKDYHQKNPDKLQYHIEIKDNTNVLSKIEQLFQGDYVSLNRDEYSVYNEIEKVLDLNIPSFSNFGMNHQRSNERICFKDSLGKILRKEEFNFYN